MLRQIGRRPRFGPTPQHRGLRFNGLHSLESLVFRPRHTGAMFNGLRSLESLVFMGEVERTVQQNDIQAWGYLQLDSCVNHTHHSYVLANDQIYTISYSFRLPRVTSRCSKHEHLDNAISLISLILFS
jgi:hypothetical protein